MKIINLTPHAINLVAADGTLIETFEPSGSIARCQTVEIYLGKVNDHPIYKAGFGPIENLPEGEEDTIYLVSMPVGQALSGQRPDIYGPNTSPTPNGAVRDADGKIIGTKSLVKY